ncbi:MAG TPA: hypothetical protein VGM39_11005 [Kofleriaceae bacterium]|jgi:hypothetical protein
MTVDILQTLIDMTPAPPATTDPDEFIAAFEAMYAARQAVLITIQERFPDTAEVRLLAAQLAARDAAWETALVERRDALGRARRNTTKLRGYARQPER